MIVFLKGVKNECVFSAFSLMILFIYPTFAS